MQPLNDFFASLPADEHAQAENIFQAHLDSLRTSIDEATKQGYSPQELNTLIYDDQAQVKEEMKAVLTDQEYNTFLNALPKLPNPQKLPAK